MQTEAELCATAAPWFYRLRVAQQRGAVARTSAPGHIRARRRTARHQRAIPRAVGGCLPKAEPSPATGSWGIMTPAPASLTPPGPPTKRSSPVDILRAATEGVGAFQSAHCAAINSCSYGFTAYFDAYLEQLPCPRSFYQCRDLLIRQLVLRLARPVVALDGPLRALL